MKNRAFDHRHYTDWRKPEELIPYEKNAKIHDEKQIKNLVTSLKRFGWQQDCVITSDNVLVIGHGRRMAAMQIGCEIPVHVIDKKAEELTDEDIRELRIADNKTNESPWDFELLTDDLDGLDFEGFDFDFDIPSEEEGPAKVTEDDWDKPLPKEPRSKRGDIWQLGRHRLICGDSTDSAVIDRLMDGVKADMVFTDPPYGVGICGGSGGKGKNNRIMGDISQTAIPFSFEIAVNYATKQKSHFYYCGAESNLLMYEKLFDKYLYIVPKHIIWVKNGFSMKQNGYHNQYEVIYFGYKRGSGDVWYGGRKENEASDVWRIDRDASSAYVHPTQKPIEIPARAIRNSCPDNGIVLDMFGGSGSTLIACEQLKRKCYMCELDQRYVDVIIDRWETFTGEKAVLING